MSDVSFDEKTAYHEAGHAVIDFVVGLSVLRVTIEPDGNFAGKTCVKDEEIPPEWDTYYHRSPGKEEYIRRYTLAKLAGYAAVKRKFPNHHKDEGDRRDETSAQKFVDGVSWENQEQYLEARRAEVSQLVLTHWAWIERVAKGLMEEGTLSGNQVLALKPSAPSWV
jgi:hypothetical protein